MRQKLPILKQKLLVARRKTFLWLSFGVRPESVAKKAITIATCNAMFMTWFAMMWAGEVGWPAVVFTFIIGFASFLFLTLVLTHTLDQVYRDGIWTGRQEVIPRINGLWDIIHRQERLLTEVSSAKINRSADQRTN